MTLDMGRSKAISSTQKSHLILGDKLPDKEARFDAIESTDPNRSKMELIQERIESGYYNSDKYLNDISEKLGRILDQYD